MLDYYKSLMFIFPTLLGTFHFFHIFLLICSTPQRYSIESPVDEPKYLAAEIAPPPGGQRYFCNCQIRSATVIDRQRRQTGAAQGDQLAGLRVLASVRSQLAVGLCQGGSLLFLYVSDVRGVCGGCLPMCLHAN